jgi:two-component system sensor kinase FixL
MNIDGEQVARLEGAAVWAEEKSETAPKGNKLPGVKLLMAMILLATMLAVGASVWVYIKGLNATHALAESVTENARRESVAQVAEQARHWAFQMELAAVAGGAGFFGIASLGGWVLVRRWQKRHHEGIAEAESRAQRLLGQLADARVSQEEYRNEHAEMQTRLAGVTQTYASLQRELDQRKQAEKTMAQQTQQLERSKDFLEMHVQQRTQELQIMQRRNELILNSAGEGICGFDLQGRTTFVNPAAAKITGWKVEELLGKTEDAIFFPALPKGAKPGPELLKNEKGEYLPQQTLYRRDGTEFPAEYVRSPIKENNKVVGSVVMFKDITERRLAEDKLSHKAEELARSNRELEQFAFVASHDLQEPLRKIQAFGDRLKLKCEAARLEDGRDYLERMQNAAARMQTLINDLLTFSRVISSSQPFVPVNLAAVTKEVLVDLEHRIEKTNGRIEVGKLPVIDADPTQMRQLLQNLIGNALKFQAPGALPVVKIDAQLVTRDQIHEGAVLPKPPPTARPDDQFCVLTVQDNGIGFEEEYLEKIFAVFQRLHGRSEYEGTGVGLAVCRRITDRHGGLITAQSKLGEGSIFIAILPLCQPNGKAAS